MTAKYTAALIFALLISGCIGEVAVDEKEIPVYGYRVVAVHPHDPGAFTQGLAYRDGLLYEGTGLYGRSSLRETVPQTGEVVRYRALPTDLFGEGIVLLEDRIVQLTWRSGVGLVWDTDDLTVVETFFYATEGWGITSDGERLIMSDGTSKLRFLDPETFKVIGGVEVLAGGEPLLWLNELEYIDGLIYANVWKTDRIAIISPEMGVVVAWIDLSGLLTEEERERADVLNGIAHDPETGRLFVTGKLWPKLFEIEVVK
ncbi:glutaminyl-peptide cyclotransferase [Candidatus Methanocrinis natronophilus]|uniref:Glutaminyl-peptide cyclotransferase n=1 Tax=Candidatus Methanocrinis natronophilus TaxID=3033396 RepID=A0ABT5X5J1_9EURY|nr:glutaminyl-peptide cyclotransferase [Candidatus Methanocrinis natronophilus]MDF0589967.1 glutaminyl-peptide cyclotransferase [Candidatus Methanocrinis natronophilus]